MAIRKRLLSFFLISTIVLILLGGILILCLSPIAIHLIEKYDKRFTGREIKVGSAYLNPFSGYISLKDIRIFELESDSVFIDAKQLSGYFSICKAFSKTYAFSGLELVQPVFRMTQNGKQHNFDDLGKLFRPKPGPHKAKTRLEFNDLLITNGTFYFTQPPAHIRYSFKHIDLNSPGWGWNSDSLKISYAIESGIGSGTAKGHVTFYPDEKKYAFSAGITKFDLKILDQYLHDLSNLSSMNAIVDAHLEGGGDLGNRLNIRAKGLVTVNDFHFGKKGGEDYASFRELTVSIREVDHNKAVYFLDSVVLSKPFFSYERYDHLDNIQKIFGTKGAKVKEASRSGHFNLIIELARYTSDLVEKVLKSHYRIDLAKITEGDFRFSDYSLSEKFSIETKSLFVKADSIDKHNKRINVLLNSGLKPFGALSVHLSIDPHDENYFDMDYLLNGIPASVSNPYLVTYTSFAFNRGTVHADGKWHVVNGLIGSSNHISVTDPGFMSVTRRSDTKWIPVPIAMLPLEEPSKRIAYSIPINGSLKVPHLNFTNLVLRSLGNTIVKTAVPPPLLDLFTREDNKNSFVLNWEPGVYKLNDAQKKFLSELERAAQKDKNSRLSFKHLEFSEKEKERICFFEARKKYLLEKTGRASLNGTDSVSLEKLSVKDKAFNRYLDKHVNSRLIFTAQEKCRMLINDALVQKKFRQLTDARYREVQLALGNDSTIHAALSEHFTEAIPYSGFSCYKIHFSGEQPRRLARAYRKMNECHEKWPGRLKPKHDANNALSSSDRRKE